MRLNHDDDLAMLSEMAASFLENMSPAAAIRTLRDRPEGYNDKVWAGMSELGWPAAIIPETYGGLGLGYRGMGVLLEQVGGFVAASPLMSSALVAATFILRAGDEAQKQRLLPQMAAGRLQVALALDETPHHDLDGIRTTAEADGADFVLSGSKVMVENAHSADLLIVVARSAREPSEWVHLLVETDAPGVHLSPLSLIDERDYARVVFDAVRVPASSRLGCASMGQAALDDTLAIANIGLAAELYGIAAKAHRITVDYLKERRQFGVPIGRFQALQHRASHMAAELEMGLSAARAALAAIDENDPKLQTLASAAKVKLSQVAHLVTTEAIQLHGGMGMTDEMDIGFYLKRARVARAMFGDASYHLNRFATLRGY